MTGRFAPAAVLLGLGLVQPGAGAVADLAEGERLFRSQCMGCHALEPGRHRAGPTLHAVIGREAGTVDGFDFSPAMAEAGITWTPATLDKFLADPMQTVPGTRMVFWGLEPAAAREHLIRYLEIAAGQPG
jgi:cytochrome c